MNGKACAYDEKSHDGEKMGRVDILPETLLLHPDIDSINFDEISSLVSIHFCEKHWEECKNRVLIDDDNILRRLQIRSENPRPTISYHDTGSPRAIPEGELECRRQELIRNTFEENPREKEYRRELYGRDEKLDDVFEEGDVQRKFTEWTLEEIPVEKLGRTEKLKHELVDELSEFGYSAERIYHPGADVHALIDGEEFYIQVRWLNEDSDEVTRAERTSKSSTGNMYWERSIPSDIYYSPQNSRWPSSVLRRFANEEGGIPLIVLRWDDDEDWYVVYYQPSSFGEYITIEDYSRVPMRLWDDFTPLPTLEEISGLLNGNKRFQDYVDETVREFHSNQPLLVRMKYWYRRYRSTRV